MKKNIKIIMILMLTFTMSFQTVFATNISELKEKKEELTDDIDEKEAQLVDLLAEISMIQDDIQDYENQIKETQKEYKSVQKDLEEQEALVMDQIQYMYECGDTSFLDVLFESESFSSAMSKMEYINEVSEYDYELIESYKDTMDELQALEEELNETKSAYETSLLELEEEEEILRENISDLNIEYESTQNLIDEYYAEIEAKIAAAKSKSNITISYPTTYDLVEDSNGTDGQDIVDYACQFIGNPYVYGGASLTNGTDCSGFTQSVYKHFGYLIARTSYQQRYCGTNVDSLAEAVPGDLIVYSGHVGIYMGNGMIVHAASTNAGITISSATYRTYVAIRRIIV